MVLQRSLMSSMYGHSLTHSIGHNYYNKYVVIWQPGRPIIVLSVVSH